MHGDINEVLWLNDLLERNPREYVPLYVQVKTGFVLDKKKIAEILYKYSKEDYIETVRMYGTPKHGFAGWCRRFNDIPLHIVVADTIKDIAETISNMDWSNKECKTEYAKNVIERILEKTIKEGKYFVEGPCSELYGSCGYGLRTRDEEEIKKWIEERILK